MYIIIPKSLTYIFSCSEAVKIEIKKIITTHKQSVSLDGESFLSP